jgi:hypothetical protein
MRLLGKGRRGRVKGREGERGRIRTLHFATSVNFNAGEDAAADDGRGGIVGFRVLVSGSIACENDSWPWS